MKRNLSSQAIKAMAIGMAVMMGSSTAISGVITGTVVNAYANQGSGTNGSTKPENTTNKFIEVPIGEAYAMFQITADDAEANGNTTSSGKVKLVSIKSTTQIEESGTLDGIAERSAYKGVIGGSTGDLVQVTYNTSDKVAFKMTEVAANSADAAVTVDGTEFSKLAKNLETVDETSFKNYTFTNGLDLSQATSLTDYKKSLAGVTVEGELKLKTDVNLADAEFTGSTIGSLDLSTHTGTIDVNSLKGTKVTGELKLAKSKFSTLAKDCLNASNIGTLTFTDGVTFVSEGLNGATIGTLNLSSDYTGVANAFKGATITNLQLPSGYTGVANDFDGITQVETLDFSQVDKDLANSTFEGSKIGTLKLHANNTFKNESFKNATITTLEHNGKALMGSDSAGANITNLTFASGVTEIVADAFKNATIPNKITLTEVKTIGANAFAIKAPDTVTVELPAYTDGDVSTIDAAAFGDASGKNFTINVAEGVTEKTLTDKLTNKKVTVKVPEKAQAPTLKTATIENTNPSEVVLKFSEAVKVKDVGQQPAKTEFVVKVDGTPNEVTAVSEIAQDATSDTVKLTLTTPVTKGQTVTIAYTPGNNKILNAKDVELEKIADAEVKNNVGVVEGDFTATTAAGTYTFQKLNETSVALTKFEATAKGKKSAGNTFVNGIFTQNDKTYTLTQIGTGTVVAGLTDAALKGHTNNVTVVKANAFKDNTAITEISLPKVTTVEAGAFNGATKLAKMDLGSETTNKVTIASDALVGTTSLKNITTNAASASDIKNKVPNADVVVESESKNDSKASIRYNAYYQTKDGLRFVGINDKELKFVGTKTYQEPTNGKFDGTEANPYEVTYDKLTGTVIVKPGKDEVVVDTVEVTQNGYKLTFDVKDGNATLTNAVKSITKATTTTTGTLANGVVTANGKTYNFTTIGNGTDALATDFNATAVLKDNLNKVTTIAKDAFKNNTATTELTLPAVTTIGDNAFNGATGLTKVDLGTNEVTVGADAFNGATSVKVTSGNQTTIDNVINDGKLDAGKVETPESKKFVKSAVIENSNASEIKLTLNDNLKQALDAKDGFSVKVNGVDATINSVAGGDSSSYGAITITLQNAVNAGETVTVSYDGKNSKGDDLLAFADKSVENKVEKDVDAKVTDAKVNNATLTITTTEGLEVKGNLASTAEFTVTKSSANTPINISKVEVQANAIVLTVDNIEAGDTEIKFAYAGNNAELISSASKKPIRAIPEMFVVNENDSTAPKLTSGSYDGSTKKITVQVDEPLKEVNAQSGHGFTVEGTTTASDLEITDVQVAENGKEIVLTVGGTNVDNIQNSETLKLTYTQASATPDGNKIKDIKGNELDNSTELSGITVTGGKAVKGYVEYNTAQTTTTGDVTVISVETPVATSILQDMLTNNLRRIERLALNGYTSLDFSKVNVSTLNIDRITGGTLNITGLTASQQLELARRVNGVSGIEINYKTPQQIIDINYDSGNGNNGSSSGGSSSGSSSGGAIIGGVTDSNTENNNNNNNNSNNQVSQDKQLTFDAISLPSINGEPKMFGDVPANHWAKSYIDKLSTAGIINGANGNFMPNGQTKRADVTIMLVNLLGLSPEVNNKFADVNPNAYYAPYVGTASSYGIVNGSNGMFNPEGIISRQDTMVMIAQILKGLNLNVNTDASSLGQFSDLGSVSSYAQESVAILVNSGIITGNNGKLNPKAPVTRAEMATIMSKLYDVLAAAK